jgi:hypothetical protein
MQYLPTILGGPLPKYDGYKSTVNPQIDIFFANVAFRYGHSAINQLVLRIDDHGEPIREGHILFRNAFYKTLCDEVMETGIDSILRGFSVQRDQVIDTKFVDDIRSYLPLGSNFDLTAIGIERFDYIIQKIHINLFLKIGEGSWAFRIIIHVDKRSTYKRSEHGLT